MKSLLVVLFFIFLFLFPAFSSAAGAIDEVSMNREVYEYLRGMGSRAILLDLKLTYEAETRDLVRGGQILLTTWNVKARVNGQIFEVLGLNILVPVPVEGLNDREREVSVLMRLASAIDRQALEVSRIGK